MSSRVRSMVVLAALLTLVGTAALRLDSSPSSAAVSSTLHATVGPAFEISLTFDHGSAVGALPAGSYRILGSDLTSDHNTGAAATALTGAAFSGRASRTVTLAAGQWKLYPSGHPAGGITFRVT